MPSLLAWLASVAWRSELRSCLSMGNRQPDAPAAPVLAGRAEWGLEHWTVLTGLAPQETLLQILSSHARMSPHERG